MELELRVTYYRWRREYGGLWQNNTAPPQPAVSLPITHDRRVPLRPRGPAVYWPAALPGISL